LIGPAFDLFQPCVFSVIGIQRAAPTRFFQTSFPFVIRLRVG
jgi:hypothetical protein